MDTESYKPRGVGAARRRIEVIRQLLPYMDTESYEPRGVSAAEHDGPLHSKPKKEDQASERLT
jgi:hypothetical protein